MLGQDSKQPRRLYISDFIPREGVKPKYLPYFSIREGENTITKAEANALVEQARANCIEIKEALKGMHFYNVKKRIQGEADFITWSQGATSTSIIEDRLNDLADNHRLIAWLMESLNTITKMNGAITILSVGDYLENVKGWEHEKVQSLMSTKADSEYTESMVKEYLETLTVEELSEYLSVEAEASVYGKALSKDGEVTEIYTEFLRAVSHPTIFDKPNASENNNTLVVTTFDLTVPKTEMVDTYDMIMKHYVELQKKLKSYQARMLWWIDQRKAEIESEEKRRILTIKEMSAELSVWKKEQLKKIAHLYIVIPNNLKSIVDRLNR